MLVMVNIWSRAVASSACRISPRLLPAAPDSQSVGLTPRRHVYSSLGLIAVQFATRLARGPPTTQSNDGNVEMS